MKKKISELVLIIFMLGFVSNFILGAPFDPMDFIKEPHDNHSYSGGEAEVLRMTPRALVWREGCWEKMEALCDGLAFDSAESAAQLLRMSNVIVIPSYGLSESSLNTSLKATIELFVALGGSLVVMNQRYGRDMEAFVPRGDELKVYCGQEVQSHRRHAGIIEGMHPVLSSFMDGRADVAVDGYFAKCPADATILLKELTNLEPVLIYYPFGRGKVFLSCLYSDCPWGIVQLSNPERLLFQNLITFAAEPSKDIPTFDLLNVKAPELEFKASIKNRSLSTSYKARFTFYAANQTKILHQVEISKKLPPGAQKTIPLKFTLEQIADRDLGICRGEYLLLDQKGKQIQRSTPIRGSLFALLRFKKPYSYEGGDMPIWLTVEEDPVLHPQNIVFYAHFKNMSDETKTVDIKEPYICVNHNCREGDFKLPHPIHLVIPPGETGTSCFEFSTSNLVPDKKEFKLFQLYHYDDNDQIERIGRRRYVQVLNPTG